MAGAAGGHRQAADGKRVAGLEKLDLLGGKRKPREVGRIGIGLERRRRLVAGLGGHQDASPIALRKQPAQRADMVFMGMRDQHRVDVADVPRQRRVVFGASRADLDAKVEQDTPAATVDGKAGAALFAEAAEQVHPHRHAASPPGMSQPEAMRTRARAPAS